MSFDRYESWGRYPRYEAEMLEQRWRDDPLPKVCYATSGQYALPFGNGRSYGDVCLNDSGVLLSTRSLNHFISFDSSTGILRCESGVLLRDILQLTVPRGWFLPVTPGTQFVTAGGAIANDVHGKNHHKAGTFGCHVNCFELLRSNDERLLCSPSINPDWFKATIGGLGLTGLITWIEIQLKPIKSHLIQQQIIRYKNIAEFLSLSEQSDREWEYTVAWLDCHAKGKNLGRGLFIRGNHSTDHTHTFKPHTGFTKSVPFNLPFSLIAKWTSKPFNTLYYYKQLKKQTDKPVHYEPFFYPLDNLRHWNRIYGPKGFLQFQCNLPHTDAERAIEKILTTAANSGSGSPLATLKVFGDRCSPGLLSFPKPGITLALDFPNQGQETFQLVRHLIQITRDHDGSVYPAKDTQMSAADYQSFFPNWNELVPFIDPNFSSSFWRRVTGVTP